MKTLLETFKERVKKIDEVRGVKIESPAIILDKIEEPKQEPVKLYNIFKRSLPVKVNTLVFHNVPEEDVTLLFRYFLRPKKLVDDTIIYWDAVLTDNPEAFDVYSNLGIKITYEDGSNGSNQNINTYREGLEKETDWRD